MTRHHHRPWAAALLLTLVTALQACSPEAKRPEAPATTASPLAFEPVTVTHALGTTVIERPPQRVVALDMNEADFLDQLGVPIAGMPKDYVPHFLARYKDDPAVQDVGAIVQPNLERIHALKPDLVLLTSIQANHYQELVQIAPTLHFDVDFRNSHGRHLAVVQDHLLTLGRIFGKQALAQQKAAELEAKVEEVRRVTQGRPEKALVVMHNKGAFSSFGVQSRYAFVFDELGVKSADPAVASNLHGQPISNEFIQQANPDILYVIDRTSIMEHGPSMDEKRMDNPLLRQTNAWKNGRVVLVDSEAWYVTAASVSSLARVIDDVIKGYRD